VYGETEKEALGNAQKEFAKSKAEKRRIFSALSESLSTITH
jgi:hypothetical protein